MHACQSARPWYRSPLSLAIAATLACAPAMPALAQDSPDAPGRADAQDDALTLDTVVVTANKRVENIREVAASITVVGERHVQVPAQLQDVGVQGRHHTAGWVARP